MRRLPAVGIGVIPKIVYTVAAGTREGSGRTIVAGDVPPVHVNFT